MLLILVSFKYLLVFEFAHAIKESDYYLSELCSYAAAGTDTPPHIFVGIFIIAIGTIPLIGIANAYIQIQVQRVS